MEFRLKKSLGLEVCSVHSTGCYVIERVTHIVMVDSRCVQFECVLCIGSGVLVCA